MRKMNGMPTSEAVRGYNMKARLGITPEQWDEIFENQGRVCALCQVGETNKWCTDHRHNQCPPGNHPGKYQVACLACIRGILCFGCNTGLGHFREDPALLLTAIEYLAFHASQR